MHKKSNSTAFSFRLARVASTPKLAISRSFSKSINLYNNRKEYRFVMSGPSGSGKTSLLYHFKFGEFVDAAPTIGYNIETIKIQNQKLTIWDLGNIDNFEASKRRYYNQADGIVYTVDSTNLEQLIVAKRELREILKYDELCSCPVLILCNKQDIPAALSINQICEKLELHSLTSNEIHTQPSSVVSGNGLLDGLIWLVKASQKKA